MDRVNAKPKKEEEQRDILWAFDLLNKICFPEYILYPQSPRGATTNATSQGKR